MLLVGILAAAKLHDQWYTRFDVVAAGQVNAAQRLEERRLAVALVALHNDARRVDLALSRGELVDLVV